MLYFIGIIISVFLFLLLIQKRNKSKPDKILACWMAIITIHQLLFYFEYSGVSNHYPHLLGLTLPLPILHGMMLFFYVSETTREKSIRFKTVLIHCIPFLLLVLLALPFYTLTPEAKKNVFKHEGEGFEWYNFIQLSLILILGSSYVLWSLILIRRHRRHMQQLLSNTDRRNLKWLEYLSIGLGIIWLLVIFFDNRVIFSGVVALVLFIGFFGINQLQVFSSNSKLEMEKASPTPPEKLHETAEVLTVASARYAKSGLKEDEANRVYDQLRWLMEKEALYTNSDLTLTELAQKINIHPNYLSQVINEKEQKNFYHYINTLRINEFIRRISTPENQQFTLLSVAFDCGFNSKSTFNKYFKQYTGQTPSNYFKH